MSILTVLNSILSMQFSRWQYGNRHTSRHPQFRTPTSVSGHGWIHQGGAMQALWTTGYVLPKQLVDILYSTVKTQKTVRERMTAMSTRMIPVTKTYSWGLITERVYGEPCQLPDCTVSLFSFKLQTASIMVEHVLQINEKKIWVYISINACH